MAEEFCKGLGNAGVEYKRFDTAKMNIHPCNGCDHCRKTDGTCVYKDDMADIYPYLIDCDVIVLVTPLYYFGMTAQLKHTIDRFYSVNASLREKPKKLYLLAACADEEQWAMDGLTSHIEIMCRYLHWEYSDSVLAFACSVREDIANSKYAEMPRNLGAKISAE